VSDRPNLRQARQVLSPTLAHQVVVPVLIGAMFRMSTPRGKRRMERRAMNHMIQLCTGGARPFEECAAAIDEFLAEFK
jgi:hypothetical protein